MSEFVVARKTFTGNLDGRSETVQKGEIISARHPIVRKWPDEFEAVRATRAERGIEDMTRSPGRRRALRTATA